VFCSSLQGRYSYSLVFRKATLDLELSKSCTTTRWAGAGTIWIRSRYVERVLGGRGSRGKEGLLCNVHRSFLGGREPNPKAFIKIESDRKRRAGGKL